MKGKTKYIKKSQHNFDNWPGGSAGPRPNIKGMRKLYYGFESDIAIQGQYIYNLGIGGLKSLGL